MWPVCCFFLMKLLLCNVTLRSLPGKFKCSPLNSFLVLVECARGVMVIVAGNWHGDTSSNPGRDWLLFTYH